MKKYFLILMAVMVAFTLCLGTAFAKKGENNGNQGKSTTQNTIEKVNKLSDKISKGQEKQLLKNQFKEAVAPYLAQIKANKKAWGQAGGLNELEGVSDQIENAIETLINGSIPVTPEQLAAIKTEVDKIKAYKASLKTDKSALQTAWKSYITAKKTYNTDAAKIALQKVIDLQKTRIDARKGIFVSMANIINILKQALTNPVPPAPSASPSPSPAPSVSPSPSETPSASPSAA